MLKNVTCWPFSDDVKKGMYECEIETKEGLKKGAYANEIIINSGSGSKTRFTLKFVKVSVNINYCLYLEPDKEIRDFPLLICSDNFEDMAVWERNADSYAAVYPDTTFTIRRYGYERKDLERLEAFRNL